ncbi:MAG: TIGR03435 family protein [Bryobacteraceae bacterium]
MSSAGIRLVAGMAAAALAAGAAAGQTAPPPAFEVASVKAAEPLDPAKLMAGQQRIGVTIDAARVDMTGLTLADLIRAAYKVKSYQISGPEWIDTQRYDIVAKLPEGAPRSQIPEMLQSLLVERFRLTLHRSTKEEPAYALAVAKGGPKLKASPPDPSARGGDAAPDSGSGTLRYNAAADSKGVVTTSGPSGNVKQTTGPNGMHLDIQKMTMPVLAEYLARFTERPVVDTTELKGNYDFVLDLSREELLNVARAAGMAVPGPGAGEAGRAPVDAAADPSAVSLANSIELLGLKLEPRKLPVEVLVIDHLEKVPVAN